MGDTPEKPKQRTPFEILNEPAICANCIHHRIDKSIFVATGENHNRFCTHPDFEPEPVTDPISGEKLWAFEGRTWLFRWPPCKQYNEHGQCHRFEQKPEDWDESQFEGWRGKFSDPFP